MAKKVEEFRALSDLELDAKVYDYRRGCFEMRNNLATKTSDVKPHQVREKRKDIARLLTIQQERRNPKHSIN